MKKEQKERVALFLLTSKSLKEAAEKSEISISTLYKLRKQESFQQIVRQVKNNLFSSAMQKAQAYTLETLDVLRTIMLNESATDSARVAAGRTILEMGFNSYDTEEIIAKLTKLEEMLNEN